MFNKEAFVADFATRIESLRGAERIVKAELLVLSRSVLEALHVTQDIVYVNDLIKALTPVNRKVAILYFQEFSGFQFSQEKQEFTKKDKKIYDEAVAKSNNFLDDPLNNIWSWAARNVEIEAKEFTLERMKKQFESTLKKAKDNQFTELQVIETFMEAGLKMDTLIALMDKIAGKEEQPVKE